MRRFLLFLGSFPLGGFVFVLVLNLLLSAAVPTSVTDTELSVDTSTDVGTSSSPSTSTLIASGVLIFLILLAFGMALSAPFFMDPPERIGIWSFSAPIFVWLFILIIRLMSGIGLMILWGCWSLVFLVWKPRSRFANQAQPVYRPQPHPVMPHQQPQIVVAPPSWQNDPTGRYMKRYWNGTGWTHHVANGQQTDVDPV